jgi:hypothetical protein
VVSAYSEQASPTAACWDDELLKIEGPELLRLPLSYASGEQAVLRIQRLATKFLEPGSGLVTPIECEKFSDGVRLLFRPKADAYVSSREEKVAARGSQGDGAATPSPKKTGYVSPEKEAAQEGSTKDKDKASSEKKPRPEGGLEIIVDASPYRRVRVRRCSMAPDTVVKEESEALILRALVDALNVLESDYRIILSKFQR